MKHASARMKVYTFSHPQYERIANTRGWRSFIFGLALAERQRAAPISDQACFQHTSVSTCISVLQYLRLSTGVLAYRYWSTEPSVLTCRERKNSPQTAPRCQCQPKNKTLLLRKTPIRAKKKIKNRPFHRYFSTFWRHLALVTAITPALIRQRKHTNCLYGNRPRPNVKIQISKTFLKLFFANNE